MLEGAFQTRILGRDVAYEPASAWTEPAEEKHANVASLEGARVLIVQLANNTTEMAALHRTLFDEIVHVRSPDLLADASRMESECANPDDLTPIVLEGVALAMLARTARLARQPKVHSGLEKWMLKALEYLHAHRLDAVQLADVAREVDVLPSQLAHGFRARLNTTPGEYLRRLRVDWAAEQLIGSRDPIAEIALSAGFFDQSHFTRVFRRHYGVTPDRWRTMHGLKS